MELLRQEQLKALLEPCGGPCVSIFLPTHRGGSETRQGPIRLKNQLRTAEQELVAAGLKPAEAKTLLEPGQRLCENAGFWQYQSDGLALFVAPGKFLYYRLPLHFPELVVVTDRFHVKPLMQLFAEDGLYYLLALSQNEVRLYQCTRYGAREVALPENTPKSLGEVLAMAGVEKQFPQASGASAKFHGHGARADDSKQDLREFFRLVDRGVYEVLRGDRAPLVLAGVDYLFPLYRETNTYPYLIEKGVTGNPEGRRPEDLVSDAWAVVEPHFRKAREDAARRYQELKGSARASAKIREIVPAACQGRVEQLFVAVDRQQWGSFDPSRQKVRLSRSRRTGDEDLLDLAAIQTFLTGGSVYATPPEQVPDGSLLAAVFRY